MSRFALDDTGFRTEFHLRGWLGRAIDFIPRRHNPSERLVLDPTPETPWTQQDLARVGRRLRRRRLF